jgi:ubiquinone/menaquinone biosynthesis C-methylase UbiE
MSTRRFGKQPRNKGGHRLFAAVYDRMASRPGRSESGAREDAVGGCRGRTLEIGFGPGPNWRFLPPGVEYTGIEPDPWMRAHAQRRMAESRLDLDLRDGDAQALDFPGESFDTVLATLVLCTIPDPDLALREIRRVLAAAGELRFWEHVRPHGRVTGRLADIVSGPWARLGAGCRPNRDTLETIRRAGFEVVSLRQMKVGPLPAIVGVARPVADSAGGGEG